MTKKSKALLVVALAVMSTGILAGCGNDEKIGYVDKVKIVQEMPKYQEVEKKLEAKRDEINKRLEVAHQSQSPEEFQKTRANAAQELAIYENALMKEVQSYLDSNVAQIAQEKKLSIVIDKRGMTSGGIDITDDLAKKVGITDKKDDKAKDGQTNAQNKEEKAK